jgi:hypothetical protein
MTARLAWAQEFWSSNLHAPTKSLSLNGLQKAEFSLLRCGSTWEQSGNSSAKTGTKDWLNNWKH